MQDKFSLCIPWLVWLDVAPMKEKPLMKRTKKPATIIPYMEVASW
jgi:hypothetical protein